MMNKLPEWFTQEVYKKGGEITNPLTGNTTNLSPEELSMYDFIKGYEIISALGLNSDALLEEYIEGITWFKDTNPKAYMVLLD